MTPTANLEQQLVVDPDVAVLIPPLRAEERKLLEQSLQREGCREPLVVRQQDGVLLDGHNRHEICTRLGIPFTTRTMSFATTDESLLWVAETQLGRRNLADIDRVKLVEQLLPALQARAAANQGRRTDIGQNSARSSESLATRESAAAAAGVSHDTYAKAKKVLDEGVPELVQAVRAGEASIHAAAAIVELPADEQVEVVTGGNVTQAAKALREGRRQKNTGNNEWGTPRSWIDTARGVLGAIDVDPATHASAQARVQAAQFFTADDDGLNKEWHGRVFLNPPYAKTLIKRFVEKLVEEYGAGRTTAAVLLVNNETDTAWFDLAANHATYICFPKGRIRFLQPTGRTSKHGPLQGQAVLYFGTDGARFVEVFSKLGLVMARVPSPAEVSDG